MPDLKILKKKYSDVEGFIATDLDGNEMVYEETEIVPLIATSNGIYKAPKGQAYGPVIANVTDTSTWHEGSVDLTSWNDLVLIGRSGNAPAYMEIGGTISGTYTLLDGTTYDYPWIIVDFQTVELEDGSTYDNVPILEAKYTGHTPIYSYSGGNVTSWGTSYLRSYMSSQTYLNYFPSEMISALHPIKITTCVSVDSNGTETYEYTFNKMWLKSSIEVCPTAYQSYNFASANEGSQFDYYEQLLGTSNQAYTFTNSAMIRYDCSSTAEARSYWTRSRNMLTTGSTSNSIFCFNASGKRTSMNGANTTNTAYVLPCFALI